MNPPVEDWITYNQEKFEKSIKEAGDLKIEIGRRKYDDVVNTRAFKNICLVHAFRFLKDELYYRQIQIKEKHC